MANPDYEWWTVAELAERWRVERRAINRMIESGALPAMSAGRKYRIHYTAIEKREAGAKPIDRPIRKHVPAAVAIPFRP